jgi:hypothetical protein
MEIIEATLIVIALNVACILGTAAYRRHMSRRAMRLRVDRVICRPVSCNRVQIDA